MLTKRNCFLYPNFMSVPEPRMKSKTLSMPRTRFSWVIYVWPLDSLNLQNKIKCMPIILASEKNAGYFPYRSSLVWSDIETSELFKGANCTAPSRGRCNQNSLYRVKRSLHHKIRCRCFCAISNFLPISIFVHFNIIFYDTFTKIRNFFKNKLIKLMAGLCQ